MMTDSNEQQGESHHLLIVRDHYHVDTLGHIAERRCSCSLNAPPHRYVCAVCVDTRSRASLAAVPNHALVQLLESALSHPESADGNIRQVIEILNAAASSPLPAFSEDRCMFCGGKTAHEPNCSHGRLTRFKVGDRLRNVHASYLPIATVTEITPRGFKYELERPLVISPRLGTQIGGESYDDSQWEPAPAEPEGEQLARQIVGTVFDNSSASHETLKRTMIERIADRLAATPPKTPVVVRETCANCESLYQPYVLTCDKCGATAFDCCLGAACKKCGQSLSK